jgi:L-aminopeptidase/D-esterase-like protein
MELAGTEALMKAGLRGGFRRENTTLVVVATNARLSKVQATKLAQLAGLGVARTIYPVNTMSDGDVVFALSLGNAVADVDALGVAGAEAVSLAILRAVKLSPTMGGVPGLASLVK